MDGSRAAPEARYNAKLVAISREEVAPFSIRRPGRGVGGGRHVAGQRQRADFPRSRTMQMLMSGRGPGNHGRIGPVVYDCASRAGAAIAAVRDGQCPWPKIIRPKALGAAQGESEGMNRWISAPV